MDSAHVKRPQGNENGSDSGLSTRYIGGSDDSLSEDCTRQMTRHPLPPPMLESHVRRNYEVEEGEVHRPRKTRRAGVYVPRLLCGVVIFVLLSLIACTFALMFVMWGKYNELRQELENTHVAQVLAQQDSHVCLPCHELLQGPFDEDNVELGNLLHKRENGTEVCCAKSSSQIATLLNLFSKQLEKCALDKINEQSGKCNSTSATPPAVSPNVISAHLLAGKQPRTNSDEEQPIKKGNLDFTGWAHGMGSWVP